ncbi:MAG: SusC/RagA family TonB-linked outer membrane protein [Bacteroidales bacterium]|nr:SusC/RagA family TonB-linked outer membrane protein [Bacteroidales bacterium]
MKKINCLLVLIATFVFHASWAQTRLVTGKVTGAEDNTALPGVTIVVKGTTVGAITNIDGAYQLEVPEGSEILEFSFVGMKTQEVSVDNRSVIDVVLEPELVGLEEVVVTALGIERKTKALGYATQSVSGDELTNSGEVNIVQSLSAKAAGVQVVSTAGTPGASSKILIRGNATFTGENQPLIVVDGIPIDNRTMTSQADDYPFNPNLQGTNDANRAIDIDPEDIESVTILKGPAAAALYGVRAGTGAIIYTTKRGKSGGIRATYSYKLDISQVNKLPSKQKKYASGTGGGDWDFVNNVSTQDDAEYDMLDFGPDMLFNTDDDVSWGTSYSWGPRISDLGIPVYDVVDDFFQTAYSHTHNASFSGGSENTTFRLSIGRTDQTGIIPNSSFDRTSFRLTSDHKFSKKLSVGGTVSYVNSGGNKIQNGSNLAGTMLTLFRCPANFNPNDDEYGYKYPTGQQRQYYYLYDNPYFSAYECPTTDDVNRIIGNMSLTYEPFDWLKADYRLGVDQYSDQRKSILATGSWQATDISGEIFENIKRNQEIYSDLLVTLSHRFGEKFSSSLTVGNNLNHRHYEDLFGRGRQLGVPEFYNLGNASELYSDETTVYIRTAALFYDVNLDYGSMIFLNTTGRNEWASTFGSNKNNFFYPSVSLSFLFSELLPADNILSLGKIRLSYAQAGINAPVYSSRTYYSAPFMTDGFTNGFAYPYMGLSGLGYSNVMGNPDLGPERVTGMEAGLDLRFFNGRLNLDLTLYDQLTTDILVRRPIPSTSGFRSVESNSGEMSNKGIELMLGGSPVRTTAFQWDITANFSKNKSEVLKLAEGVDEVQIASAFTDIGSYAIVGQSYGAFYGTLWERTPEGDLIIGDNGLPIEQLETGGIGDPFPDWLANLRNTFTFKGLSVTALLDVRHGGDVYAGTWARLNRQGTTEESADRERTFLIEGVMAQYDGEGNLEYDENGKAMYTSERNTTEVSAVDYWWNFKGDFATAEEIVTDGSWIRLREVGVSYSLKLKGRIPLLRSVDLSFTGRNLWLKTDYPGVDPETSLTGAGGDPEASGGALTGLDYFNNPSSKSFIFGAKFYF